jgi:hypothetical protein
VERSSIELNNEMSQVEFKTPLLTLIYLELGFSIQTFSAFRNYDLSTNLSLSLRLTL